MEKAAEKFAHWYDQGTCDGIAQDCFIAGATWQKEQMLKDAMPCSLEWYDGFVPNFTEEQLSSAAEKLGLSIGDKIKVIILKDNE